MGVCCSKNAHDVGSYIAELQCEDYESSDEEEELDCLGEGDYGAKVRLKGSSGRVAMFTQQGRKGTNQDAMTVWEDFAGDKDMVFCGVFDGHGPHGHRVARFARDVLPSKLSSVVKQSNIKASNLEQEDNINAGDEVFKGNNDDEDEEEEARAPLLLSSWEGSFVRSFKELDEELNQNPTMDCFCSGTTSVAIIKWGDHLMVANLGDSRAVLCTKSQNQPIPVQLTVDLKPNVKSEAARIKRCRGRVFAMDEEPDVMRVWMPEDNCPGLAMARAFGDFCLKEYGIISTPELSYRKIMPGDEFVVLATDGVWDVLTNDEVVAIVASVKHRRKAAKVLVTLAVQAWSIKFPGCKIDDCAVICLFFKPEPPAAASSKPKHHHPPRRDKTTVPCISVATKSGDQNATAAAAAPTNEDDDWNALEGVNRVNSLIEIPRVKNKDEKKEFEGMEVSSALSVPMDHVLPPTSTADDPPPPTDDHDHRDHQK